MKKVFIALFLSVFWGNSSFAELSLSDLSFKDSEVKVDSSTTKLMQERESKLQMHQKLGLATMGLMTATMIVAESAKTSDVHKYLGIASGVAYWTTAYYSLTAPKPEGVKDTGSSKIHRTLAWVHAPLMALAPVLGYLHKENVDKGKASSGLVKNHGGVAAAAFYSFMAAGLSMYFDLSF